MRRPDYGDADSTNRCNYDPPGARERPSQDYSRDSSRQCWQYLKKSEEYKPRELPQHASQSWQNRECQPERDDRSSCIRATTQPSNAHTS